MSRRVANWLKLVEDYYGSLDQFGDAGTVRIMRGFCVESLSEHTRVLNTIEDAEGRREFDAIFEEDNKLSADLLEKLDGWLKARGLEP